MRSLQAIPGSWSRTTGQSWKSCLGTAAWRVVAYRGGIVAAGERIYTYPAWRMSRATAAHGKHGRARKTPSLSYFTQAVRYTARRILHIPELSGRLERLDQGLHDLVSINDENPDIRFGCAEGDSRCSGTRGISTCIRAVPRRRGLQERRRRSDMEEFLDRTLRHRDGTVQRSAHRWNTRRGALHCIDHLGKTSKIARWAGDQRHRRAKVRSGRTRGRVEGRHFKTGDGGPALAKERCRNITYPEVASVRTIPLDSGASASSSRPNRAASFTATTAAGNWIWSSPTCARCPASSRYRKPPTPDLRRRSLHQCVA